MLTKSIDSSSYFNLEDVHHFLLAATTNTSQFHKTSMLFHFYLHPIELYCVQIMLVLLESTFVWKRNKASDFPLNVDVDAYNRIAEFVIIVFIAGA